MVGLGAFTADPGAESRAMAEEQRDLISDRGSGVLSVGDTQRCYCWGHGDGGHGSVGSRGHGEGKA